MARKVLSRDFDAIAQGIVEEQRKRAADRIDLDKAWKEIDRQLAMTPKGIVHRDGADQTQNWMPDTESANQAWSLEILAADTRRLLFPQDEQWYRPHAVTTDKVFETIRQKPLFAGDESGIPPGEVRADDVNLIVKSTIDHFHSQYAFRRHWDKNIAQALKYGTFAARMVMAKVPVVSNEFRGTQEADRKIPIMVPVSMKNTYLDTSLQFLFQEGMVIQPAIIRQYWQRKRDMEKAAAAGSKGWIGEAISNLEEKKEGEGRDHIELLEYEGDLVIPRSQGENIFLPNQIVTVAVQTDPKVVRIRDQEFPFRSYFSGVYQEEDPASPYGTSPLLKGRTLQDIISEMDNRTVQAAALTADPPGVWDRNDPTLNATNGPVIAPGYMNESDNPEAIRFLQVGNPSDIFGVKIGYQSSYEDLVGISEPRKSGDIKSHTTATGASIGESKGVLRTENFVNSMKEGSVMTFLYMEYEMIKKATGKKTTVFVNDRGVEDHFNVSSDMLPEAVNFTVQGALGAFSKREQRENLLRVTTVIAQIEPLAVQEGAAMTDWDELRREIYTQFGVTDADRFFKPAEKPTGQDETGVPGDIQQLVQSAGGAAQG